jgi:hypothetical protein
MGIAYERPISVAAAAEVRRHLDAIAAVIARDAAAFPEEPGRVVFPGLPEDLRWRVMVLGASVEDMNFWVRRRDEDGARWYVATEIETGVEVGGVSERDALENYFRMSAV